MSVKFLTETKLSVVRLITLPTGEQLIHKMSKTTNPHNLQEYNILRQLDHPNIIKPYGFDHDNQAICLNYIAGMNLMDYMIQFGKPQMSDCREIFCSIAKAVQYCHKKNIAHRDIKIDNIMIGDCAILIDFGLAMETIDSFGKQIKTFLTSGSPEYMAPEIFEAMFSKTPYDPMSPDVWALGVVLYAMVTGKFPFYPDQKPGQCCESAICDICLPKYVADIANKVSKSDPDYSVIRNEDLKTLLKGMLEKDPKKRYTIDQVVRTRWCQ